MKTTNKRDLSTFFGNVSMLVASGTTYDQIILLLKESDRDDHDGLYDKMYGVVNRGGSFSEALKECGFPAYAVHMTETAEYVGKLESVAAGLALLYDRGDKTRQQIRNAVIQPLLLLSVLCVLMGVFVVFVLPIIRNVYDVLSGDSSSYLLVSYILGIISFVVIFVVLLVFIVIASIYTRDPESRFLKGLFEKTVFTSGLSYLLAQADFLYDVGTRISGGMLANESYEEAWENIGNRSFKDKVSLSLEDIRKGENIGKVLAEYNIIPNMYSHIIYSGEKQGRIEEALSQVNDLMFRDSSFAIESLVVRIEPLLTGFFTIMIGICLLVLLLPLAGIITAMA